MTAAPIVITDHATRAEIAEAIAHLRHKHDRMPKHWADRRAEVMDEIDELVTDWLDADG